GRLEVTKATVQLDKLLGAKVPEVLRGLQSSVTTSFAIDTRKRRLEKLDITGTVDGSLFGGGLVLAGVVAGLHATPGPMVEGSLTDGLSLNGRLAGKVTAEAYGATCTLDGSVTFPKGLLDFSGVGQAGPVKVKVSGVKNLGKKLTFER